MANVTTITKRGTAGQMRRHFGKTVIDQGAGDHDVVTGLRSVEHISLTGVGATVLPVVASGEDFPQDGTVSVTVGANGTFFWEAIGYGM